MVKEDIVQEGRTAYRNGLFKNDCPYDWPMTCGWWYDGWYEMKVKDDKKWAERDGDRTGYIS